MRNKTGTHVFWEKGVHYPRVSPGAHPLTKKPEDSGYEIGMTGFTLMSIMLQINYPPVGSKLSYLIFTNIYIHSSSFICIDLILIFHLVFPP